MVHNGIEYGDMQLICEAYWMLKQALGLTNDELYDVFAEWNRGELDSYLIEITRDIFSVRDPETGGHLVDLVMDTAGAKGTGKWMSQLALDLGVPSTLVTEAVYARCLSAMRDARLRASRGAGGAVGPLRRATASEFIEEVRQALYASKIVQLRPGLRADAGRGRRTPLAAGFRLDRPVVARRLHHPRRLPGTDQGGLRRRSQAGEPAAGPVLPGGRRARPRTPGGTWWPRRSGWAFPRRPSPPPWPTTTATARRGCRPTCSRPSGITSAPTRISRVDREGVFHSDWLQLRKAIKDGPVSCQL